MTAMTLVLAASGGMGVARRVRVKGAGVCSGMGPRGPRVGAAVAAARPALQAGAQRLCVSRHAPALQGLHPAPWQAEVGLL